MSTVALLMAELHKANCWIALEPLFIANAVVATLQMRSQGVESVGLKHNNLLESMPPLELGGEGGVPVDIILMSALDA